MKQVRVLLVWAGLFLALTLIGTGLDKLISAAGESTLFHGTRALWVPVAATVILLVLYRAGGQGPARRSR